MSLLAAVPGTLSPLGGGAAQWRRFDGGATHELSALATGVLQACVTYAMRDDHVARLQRLGLARELAVSAFDALVARGLLLDFAGLMALRRTGEGPAAPATVDPLLVIRSYQRPQGLARLLDSIATGVADGATPRRVVIVDDTNDAAYAEHSLTLARRFAAAHAGDVRYLGPQQRPAALATLARLADVPVHTLATLLDPTQPSAVTGSRTWNWAVLLAAGGYLSILDDDTSFPLRLPSDANTTCDLADSSEAVVTFFDDDEGWRAAAPLPGDPYDWLAQWLAPDAGTALLARGWRDAALHGRSADEFVYLLRPAPVLGVVPGVYGGIALDTAAHLLYPNPPTLRSLWREPYDPARLDGNRLWHTYPHARFAAHAVYTPLLLDARAPLPFAGTWGRVDDTYFLMLLRAITDNATFAHVPAMLGHVDLQSRQRRERAGQSLLLDRNAYVAGLFDTIGCGLCGDDRWTRLRAVAAVCATLARAGDGELETEVLTFRNRMRGKLVEHLATGLAAHPHAPASWREIVARALASNRATMREERLSGEEIGFYRRALTQVDAAAAIWPATWDALRDDGDACTRLTAAVAAL